MLAVTLLKRLNPYPYVSKDGVREGQSRKVVSPSESQPRGCRFNPS